MKDEIIEEVWKAKDDISHEFNCDLDKLAEYLKKKEDKRDFKAVDLSRQVSMAETKK